MQLIEVSDTTIKYIIVIRIDNSLYMQMTLVRADPVKLNIR